MGENRELLLKVKDFHGHFGPFAALGIRMSLACLRELKVGRGDERLKAEITLSRLKTPYTCIIDGVQVATGCTVGNGRLKISKGKNVSLKLKLEEREVKVKVFKETLKWMRNELQAGKTLEEAAYNLMGRREEELFFRV